MDKLLPNHTRTERRRLRKSIAISKFAAAAKFYCLIIACGIALAGAVYYAHSTMRLPEVDAAVPATGVYRGIIHSGLSAAKLSKSDKPEIHGSLASMSIEVNIPSRTLELKQAGKIIKQYPVAVGRASAPTPLGRYTVIAKDVNPWWYPPRTNKAVPPGPGNPLGYRWIGFNSTYGIHGTNAPWYIGQAVSNGCIRMHDEHVKELYDLVSYGTPVTITYDLVKIDVHKNGTVSVGVYPDIYGYKTGRAIASEIMSGLASYGFSGFASESFVAQVLGNPGRQVILCKVYKIFINGQDIGKNGVLSDGILHIPVKETAERIGAACRWYDGERAVGCGDIKVPGMLKGGVVYCSLENTRILVGGVWVVNDLEGRVDYFGRRPTKNALPDVGSGFTNNSK